MGIVLGGDMKYEIYENAYFRSKYIHDLENDKWYYESGVFKKEVDEKKLPRWVRELWKKET